MTGEAATGAWVVGIDVSGSICAVATDGAGLAIYDISGAAPVPKGNVKDALHLFNVRVEASIVYAACGADGFLLADVSDADNPKTITRSATGSACYDIILPVAGVYSVISLGACGIAAADFTTPKTPLLGFANFLTSAPPLGDWDLAALRTNLNNASNSVGKIKGQALYVHALLGAKTAIPSLNFKNFEGIVIVIQGWPGRGQSSLLNSVTFEGQSVRFTETKGFIWLPSHTDSKTRTQWGRKSHELGHWLRGWGQDGSNVMPDIYTEHYEDGTELVGDAAPWDMAGEHDLGPLFSGHQADRLQLFNETNIARRRWSPAILPGPEPFEIVAHGLTEDVSGRIHLLEIQLTDSLSYYVEVRQKMATAVFDTQIPIPDGAAGRVLVTRVDEAQTLSNTFERPTMLFGILDVGESVFDAARVFRIEAAAVMQSDPLVYKVIVHWNEEPPENADALYDLRITPWNTDSWETPDIWINNEKNDKPGLKIYDSHEPGDESKPILNGDRPWVKHKNTIFARVSNSGAVDATDVYVTAYVTSPPGIGDNGSWQTLKTEKLDIIPANDSKIAEFVWTPKAAEHTCISAAIYPQAGERSPKNNRAQENVSSFDSAGSSSHEPVILEAEVRSPFSVWRRVDLLVRGLPRGWHGVVNKAWVWVPPKGSVPVSIVIWTDLNSPRERKQDAIPAQAFPRVEGWTDFATHRYLPIGGILMPIRANRRTRIAFEVIADAELIRILAGLQPASADVPGVVEITDAAGAQRLVPFITDAWGKISAQINAAPGRYYVQLFTNSTQRAAEAESDVKQVIVKAKY